MLKKILLVTAAVLLTLPAVAMAGFQTGDYEFTLNGTGSSDNDFDNNDFSMQFGLGYFFSDMLAAVLRQDLGITVRDNDDDDWNGSTALGADVNFNFATVTPFLGATIGYLYGDDVDNSWFLSPEAGVKFFVNTTTYIQALVQYQWLFDDSDDIDNNFDDGRFVYGAGIGFKW
jgi:hypothetical protein